MRALPRQPQICPRLSERDYLFTLKEYVNRIIVYAEERQAEVVSKTPVAKREALKDEFSAWAMEQRVALEGFTDQAAPLPPLVVHTF